MHKYKKKEIKHTTCCFGFPLFDRCVAGHDGLSTGSQRATVRSPVQRDTERNAARVRASAVRSRVPCPGCRSANDEEFVVCQWCGQLSEAENDGTTEATIIIDEKALGRRCLQLKTALAESASEKRRNSTTSFSTNSYHHAKQ